MDHRRRRGSSTCYGTGGTGLIVVEVFALVDARTCGMASKHLLIGDLLNGIKDLADDRLAPRIVQRGSIERPC